MSKTYRSFPVSPNVMKRRFASASRICAFVSTNPPSNRNYPVGPLAYFPEQGYGGVSFSISPGDASITVDGTLAGTVDNYNNPQSPLNLPPGQHHVRIQAPGYSTLDFDVNVEAGRVIPYAGDLQRN